MKKIHQSRDNIITMYDAICNGFNNSELKDLIFTLGIDYDNLSGSNKKAKVRELILYVERRGRIDDLTQAYLLLRPEKWNYETKYDKYTSEQNIPLYSNISPPKLAEYLLWYLPIDRKTREAIIGDIEEEFFLLCTNFDWRKATIWYYYQVGASFWPIIGTKIRKLIKLGVLGWFGYIIRHIIS